MAHSQKHPHGRHPHPSYQKPKQDDERYCHPLGTGFRPAFHALWHLHVLQIVDKLSEYGGEPWEGAASVAMGNKNTGKKAVSQRKDKGDTDTQVPVPPRPARIALIDTPVDYKHPNLCGAMDTGLMRDFSHTAHGEFLRFKDGNENKGDKYFLDADVKSRAWLGDKASKQNTDLAKAIVAEIEHGHSSERPFRVFGAHGTAVAGLIGARPTSICFREPAFLRGLKHENGEIIDDVVLSSADWLPLPYCGINPFCRIVPISISAAPSASMLRSAVEYAKLVEPDIVVIADSWDRPRDRAKPLSKDAQQMQEEENKLWDRLHEDFMDLCQETIVLCAAGNEDLSHPVYPASACTDPHGPWAVGACDDKGEDLSYSPTQTTVIGHHGWMIKTLSTELPRFDREDGERKIDPWAAIDKDLDPPRLTGREFPARDIVTTDLPRQAGYNPSPYQYPEEDENDQYDNDQYYEIGSLFTRFAGTSASVAIAAGIVSLIPEDKRKAINRENTQPIEQRDKLVKLFDWHTANDLFNSDNAPKAK